MTRAALALCALASLALASPAPAAADAEPNDDIAHPNGPLEAGSSVDGRFGSASDHDWYVLYTKPGRQIDIAVTKEPGSECSGSLDARLLDADGRKVASKTIDAGETDNIRQLSAPEPARYYLVLVTDCPPGTSGDPYRIEPGTADAITTSSPAAASRPRPDAAPTPEPNDDIVHAFGPLAGERVYGGTTGSASDEDWFVLYTKPGHRLDVAVAKVGGGCSSTIDARLYDGDGSGLQGSAVASNEIDHFRLATPALPSRFYLHVYDSCAGDAYQVHAGPAAAVDVASPLLATQPTPASLIIREPNGSLARAFGPLGGAAAYGGDFAGARDVDFVYFYPAAGQQVELALTKVGRGCSTSVEARLFDLSGRLLVHGGAVSNRVWHLGFRPRRATAYVLRLVTGCRGDPYQLRADPASALSLHGPAYLAVSPRRDRYAPYRFRVAGNLVGRLGLRFARACARGRARVVLATAGRRLATRSVRVRRDCGYAAALTVTRRQAAGVRRARVSVRVTGARSLTRLGVRRARVALG